jgi:hypothetical protein
VLANVVIGTGHLVDPVKALVSRVRQIFLVQGPRDSLVLEQVNHRGDVLRDLDERITVKPEVVSASGQHA